MIIDNFDLLSDYIRRHKTFTEDTFLFLQMIRRRKDNPNLPIAQETVKNMHLVSLEDMLQRKALIQDWCHRTGSRAYLRLNLRSKRKVALKVLEQLAKRISEDNFNIKNIYETAAGSVQSDPDKTWIIDLDDDEHPLTTVGKQVIIPTIYDLLKETQRANQEILIVPTRNGHHLITPGFNTQKFHTLTGITLNYHKDNPTILYHAS